MSAYNAVYDYATPFSIGLRPQINAALRPANMALRITGGVDALFASGGMSVSSDLERETNPINQMSSEYTVGPWASVNFEPLSILALNAGARYDTAFVKMRTESWSGNLFGYPVSWAEGEDSARWDAFVYEAGVRVNPLDFLKIYAKYGTQFRYPYLDHIILNPAYTGAPSFNIDLEPEKGRTAEGGIGLSIKNIVQLDADFYYMQVDNEIAEAPSTTSASGWAV
jgi:outer membrane receptor protein involved in Fe transport